jgi:hypothetical protein
MKAVQYKDHETIWFDKRKCENTQIINLLNECRLIFHFFIHKKTSFDIEFKKVERLYFKYSLRLQNRRFGWLAVGTQTLVCYYKFSFAKSLNSLNQPSIFQFPG